MEKVDILGVCVVRILTASLRYAGITFREKNDAPIFRTRSAISSKTLPPCITITLEAISSAR